MALASIIECSSEYVPHLCGETGNFFLKDESCVNKCLAQMNVPVLVNMLATCSELLI